MKQRQTQKKNKRILKEFIRTPYDIKPVISSNLSVIIFRTNVSKALQTEFAEVAHLAEGQFLKDWLA
jgi:hypothetical protein